jgi:hypothetical protein
LKSFTDDFHIYGKGLTWELEARLEVWLVDWADCSLAILRSVLLLEVLLVH